MLENCGHCGGQGHVIGSLYDPWGFQRFVEPPKLLCEHCGGSGRCEGGSRLGRAEEPVGAEHWQPWEE